jgi:hypothetical protein
VSGRLEERSDLADSYQEQFDPHIDWYLDDVARSVFPLLIFTLLFFQTVLILFGQITQLFKGTVQRDLRGVKNGINQ